MEKLLLLMQKRQFKLSIIIVHYKSKQDLFDCILSIESSKPKTSYEIIVVDNDEVKTIGDEFLRQFSNVSYIKSPRNVGFGAGNNIGAKNSRGEVLFFLNPDTIVYKGTIDTLAEFIETYKNVGIVAPLLLDKEKKPYTLQGSMELTPLAAIFALTFVHKYIPNNPFSNKFFLHDWDKKTVREVAVVPGSAFLVKRDAFEQAGGFDENMFLFFEEQDFCRRTTKLGLRIYINPKALVLHKWGKGGQNTSYMKRIFSKSRFYYFRKHFGLFSAIIVEAFFSV